MSEEERDDEYVFSPTPPPPHPVSTCLPAAGTRAPSVDDSDGISAGPEHQEALRESDAPGGLPSSPLAPGLSNDVGEQDVDRLGAHLARAMEDGDYHPVVLFGTNASGKTSLLLSLLTTLMTEPRLATGLVLCNPILGSETGVGRQLHNEARKLFEVMTQAFLEGEQIPATRLPLPFFVPVEVRPAGGPSIRFAFLESNGEWYRPARAKGKIASLERLYPQLRTEIEDFIAQYQGGMSFIYLIPRTQGHVYAELDEVKDSDEVESASLAIAGVVRAYDRIRANHRVNDRHLMLVTKWDAHSPGEADRAEGIKEDRGELDEFVVRKYSKALAAFQSLALSPEQRSLNAYCSGLINKRGLLQLRYDDDVREVVMSYPVRLWNWLYRNALLATDQAVVALFPEPPEPPAPIRLWRRLLDFISGR